MKVRNKKTGLFSSSVPKEVWVDIELDLRKTLNVAQTLANFRSYALTKSSIHYRNSKFWKLDLQAARKGERLQANRMFLDEQEAEMVKLYINGMSTPKISILFKCNPSTIQRIIKNHHNIEMRDASAARKGNMPTGKDHHRYIDGRCKTYPHGYRFEPEYKEWRKAVYTRDNYTCQHCGVRPSKGNRIKLNADHVLPQSIFPEFRYILNNGQTLCHPCHVKTRTYGSKMIKLKRDDFDTSMCADWLSGMHAVEKGK